MSDTKAGHGTGSDVFRWMAACIVWRFDFGQSSSRHIPRVPQRAAPYAWARPLLSWHAVVPFTFRIQVSHRTQEPPSEFLPAELGIHQGASWRITSAAIRAPRTVAVAQDAQDADARTCRDTDVGELSLHTAVRRRISRFAGPSSR
jgi:hypothetical protein